MRQTRNPIIPTELDDRDRTPPSGHFLLCLLRLHRWTRWTKPEAVAMKRMYAGLGAFDLREDAAGEFVAHRQSRECVRCGKTESRTLPQ
jgi:hypothetical protein